MVTDPPPGAEEEPGDTPVGAGLVSPGADEEPGSTPVGEGVVSAGTFPVGVPVGAHLVQTVDVEVRVTEETVEYVVGISDPPEVIVVVTGQVVTVSYVTTVVTDPSGGPETTLDGAGVVAGTSPVGVLGAVGINGVLVFEPGATDDGSVAGEVSVSVSVTGHTVVETAIVEVTTVVESAGQLTTVGAQLVIVTSSVEYTVEVVILGLWKDHP